MTYSEPEISLSIKVIVVQRYYKVHGVSDSHEAHAIILTTVTAAML